MKTFVLVAMLFCRLAYAGQTFGVEESLAHQMEIPAGVLSELSAEPDLKANGCAQATLADALEATKVNVGSKHASVLVKPRPDAWCLCGAYLCPAWIFQPAIGAAKRLWFTEGTARITILDARDRGYRRIRSEGGTAGHGFVEVWAWDGKHYARSSRKDWVADQ